MLDVFVEPAPEFNHGAGEKYRRPAVFGNQELTFKPPDYLKR
jgi:hypothetical protein